MAAIVGAAGLEPTFEAARQGRRVAFANKECLVSAGDVFMAAVADAGTELLPVDSEHSACLQALAGAAPESIERIVLTASGGPFRTWSLEQLQEATPEQALRHPNWSMGAKITIDSATLMNKGLELIEAYHLFPVTAEQLGVVIHPQSIVHCLVSYTDGSVLAQMACPDMRTPIALALSWPQRMHDADTAPRPCRRRQPELRSPRRGALSGVNHRPRRPRAAAARRRRSSAPPTRWRSRPSWRGASVFSILPATPPIRWRRRRVAG